MAGRRAAGWYRAACVSGVLSVLTTAACVGLRHPSLCACLVFPFNGACPFAFPLALPPGHPAALAPGGARGVPAAACGHRPDRRRCCPHARYRPQAHRARVCSPRASRGVLPCAHDVYRSTPLRARVRQPFAPLSSGACGCAAMCVVSTSHFAAHRYLRSLLGGGVRADACGAEGLRQKTSHAFTRLHTLHQKASNAFTRRRHTLASPEGVARLRLSLKCSKISRVKNQ